MREERQNPFALGPKKEAKAVKNIQKNEFFEQIALFCE